jgi:hypothetical protein
MINLSEAFKLVMISEKSSFSSWLAVLGSPMVSFKKGAVLVNLILPLLQSIIKLYLAASHQTWSVIESPAGIFVPL